MSPRPPRFAATALTEYWDADGENILLGHSCLRASKTSETSGFSTRLLPNPWDEPGVEAETLAGYGRSYERVLEGLTAKLDRAHDRDRGPRCWRIMAGPWLTAYLTTLCDRLLVAKAALKAAPGAAFEAPAPMPPARDTAEFLARLTTDDFNQRLYGEVFRFLGTPVARREAAFTAPRSRPAWKTAADAVAAALVRALRALRPPETVFASLYMPPSDQAALCLASGLRVQPAPGRLAAPSEPAAEDPRRAALARTEASDELERLAWTLMPAHLPRILLEDFAAASAAVDREWPRPPRAAVTSVGWLLDERFKFLAARTVSSGGRLAIAQHGGAYGMFAVLHNERHERAIADEYWTWGWTEPSSAAAPARVRPLPNPRLSRPAVRRPGDGWLLVTHAIPRFGYTFYFCNVPVWPRYPDYLAQRERFVAALPDAERARMSVRLPVEDFGWDMSARLELRWPGLGFEAAREPLPERIARARLVVVDHPQTSWLECLASGVPTLLFWDPVLWRMRPSALGVFDDLRKAGILCDTPEEGARRAAEVLKDPEAWWDGAEVQGAVARFRAGWARSSPDWAAQWAAAAKELAGSTR